MRNLKTSILPVAVVIALATGLAFTPSCKNGGNTSSSTDSAAINAANTMREDSMKAAQMKEDSMKAAGMRADSMKKADSMKTKSAIAPMPKTTKPVAMVSEPVPPPTGAIVEDKDHVYSHAEVSPAFAGGESALDDYVNDNIRYPSKAVDHGAEGKVMVHFIIDEHGNVSHVTTLGQPIGYGVEEEAIRVISKSPKWTPGKVKGKDVKTYVVLPIVFKLH